MNPHATCFSAKFHQNWSFFESKTRNLESDGHLLAAATKSHNFGHILRTGTSFLSRCNAPIFLFYMNIFNF